MSRPAGVTILGVLGIVGGVLGTLLGLAFLMGGEFLRHRAMGLPGLVMGVGAAGVGIAILSISVINIVAAVGLLTLQNWARVLLMVFAGISLGFSVLAALGGLSHFFVLFAMRRMVTAALDALVLWYLTQPHVKRAFGVGAAGAPIAPVAR